MRVIRVSNINSVSQLILSYHDHGENERELEGRREKGKVARFVDGSVGTSVPSGCSRFL